MFRTFGFFVLEHIHHIPFFFLSYGGIKGYVPPSCFNIISYFIDRYFHNLCDLFGRRLTAVLLEQSPVLPHQLVDGLHHVDRNSDRSGLVRDGADLKSGDKLHLRFHRGGTICSVEEKLDE